jgi:TPR repeat protein
VVVKQDKAEAVKWMVKAAEQGIPEAQMWVGINYWNGIDVKMDEAKGIMWLQKAADQGEPAAFHFLGGAYYLGKGVKQDYVQCYKWTLLFMETGSSSIPDDLASLKAQLADVESKLTPKQIGEGKRLAAEFGARLVKKAKAADKP